VPTAVVCDDDEMMRSVVRDLAEQRGLQVLAETDHGMDVVELVRRFGVDVVLLDLVLPDMSGEDVVEQLGQQGLHPTVVVFTAYDTDDERLYQLGVQEIIRKPGLDVLERVVTELVRAAGPASRRVAGERRQPRRTVVLPAPVWKSPSGLEPAATLGEQLATCLEGDTLLAVTVDGLAAVATRHGEVLAQDCMLEVARAFGATLRTQDSMLDEPACDGFLVILRGGHPSAGTAVWNRARRLLTERAAQLTPRATVVLVGADPSEARARAVGTVHSAPPATLTPA
jgi:CheY-like chemotaxis protein